MVNLDNILSAVLNQIPVEKKYIAFLERLGLLAKDSLDQFTISEFGQMFTEAGGFKALIEGNNTAWNESGKAEEQTADVIKQCRELMGLPKIEKEEEKEEKEEDSEKIVTLDDVLGAASANIPVDQCYLSLFEAMDLIETDNKREYRLSDFGKSFVDAGGFSTFLENANSAWLGDKDRLSTTMDIKVRYGYLLKHPKRKQTTEEESNKKGAIVTAIVLGVMLVGFLIINAIGSSLEEKNKESLGELKDNPAFQSWVAKETGKTSTSISGPQNDARRALQSDITEANKQLPMEVGAYKMEKMSIEGNDYIVPMTLDESQMDLDTYISNMNQNKSNIFSMVAGNRKEFAELFAKSGLNLKFVVTGKQSKRSEQIFLSASEIKDSMGSDYSAKDFMLQTISDMKGDLPEDWGDGLTLIDVYSEGDYMCYKVKTDESYITMTMLRQAKSNGHDLEDGILESISNPETSEERLFFKYLKDSGMGIKYIYTSSKTNGNVTVTITPEMIRSAL